MLNESEQWIWRLLIPYDWNMKLFTTHKLRNTNLPAKCSRSAHTHPNYISRPMAYLPKLRERLKLYGSGWEISGGIWTIICGLFYIQILALNERLKSAKIRQPFPAGIRI
jgi:hypothetical protein